MSGKTTASLTQVFSTSPATAPRPLTHVLQHPTCPPQEPIPLLTDPDDNSDLTNAIAKLNSGSILHTEKRALERLLAQRYEDALAAAAAASQAEEEVVLGGASEVLRQFLLVFQQNNLPTELDKGPPEPAEWRRRMHAARRRAFLVVRAMVRLKREVKRLGVPLGDLQWLVPVAAAERWGQVKALAAEYHRLEGALQDAEVCGQGPGSGCGWGSLVRGRWGW